MYLLSPRHLSFKFEKVKVSHGKVNNCDYWRPKVNDKFDSVLGNHLGKTQHRLAMEQDPENYDFGLKDANVKILKKNTDNVIMQIMGKMTLLCSTVAQYS